MTQAEISSAQTITRNPSCSKIFEYSKSNVYRCSLGSYDMPLLRLGCWAAYDLLSHSLSVWLDALGRLAVSHVIYHWSPLYVDKLSKWGESWSNQVCKRQAAVSSKDSITWPFLAHSLWGSCHCGLLTLPHRRERRNQHACGGRSRTTQIQLTPRAKIG